MRVLAALTLAAAVLSFAWAYAAAYQAAVRDAHPVELDGRACPPDDSDPAIRRLAARDGNRRDFNLSRETD